MPKLQINKSLLSYKLAQSEDEKLKFTNLALKYRLYNSGWCLSKELVNLRISDNSLDYEVCLAFYDNIPVGIILFCKFSFTWDERNHCMFFVKKSFRKNGIATKMLDIMRTKKNNIRGSATIAGSIKFFKKVGVEMFYE